VETPFQYLRKTRKTIIHFYLSKKSRMACDFIMLVLWGV